MSTDTADSAPTGPDPDDEARRQHWDLVAALVVIFPTGGRDGGAGGADTSDQHEPH